MSLHVGARNASADSGRRKFTATLADGKGIAVESSTGMRMPDDVAEAARAALGGGEIRHEFAWMSWAGTVWRLEGESRSIYVKRAAHMEDERDRLAWREGGWPGPGPPRAVSGLAGRSAVDLAGRVCRP